MITFFKKQGALEVEGSKSGDSSYLKFKYLIFKEKRAFQSFSIKYWYNIYFETVFY